MKILKLLKGLLLGYDFKSVDELAKYYFREPAKLGWWIERKIWWTQDNDVTTWPFTKQVLKDKIADCKGFSLLAYECLEIWGWRPYIMAVFGMRNGVKRGHAICFYVENKHISWFNCGEFHSLNNDDYSKLAGKVAEEMGYIDWWFAIQDYAKLKRDSPNERHGK